MSAREGRSPQRGSYSAMQAYHSRLNSPFRSESIDSETEVAPFLPQSAEGQPSRQLSRQPSNLMQEHSLATTTPGKYWWMPKLRVLEITLSEPRDVLQSERTLLSFVRFSTSLYFAATGMIMGFHLRSSGEKDHTHLPNFNNGLFNKIIAAILIGLAFATLVLSGINYFRTVRRYSQKRIHTYGFNNLTMVICVTAVVLTLIGINIALIVDRIMTSLS